ncbi:MAG: hypothetical protein SNJ57_09355 [Cyanobacteriota bacterium]
MSSATKIKALVTRVHEFLQIAGAESCDVDRAQELIYQDGNIFLLLDETTGKTWAAVSVWNEDEQQCVWESVLDVPSKDAIPEKFFTRVIPDDLETSWADYLVDLTLKLRHELELRHNEETLSLLLDNYRIQRYIRRWLGCWNADLEDWLNRTRLLKLAKVDTATIALQMFRQIYLMPSELWPSLLQHAE